MWENTWRIPIYASTHLNQLDINRTFMHFLVNVFCMPYLRWFLAKILQRFEASRNAGPHKLFGTASYLVVELFES